MFMMESLFVYISDMGWVPGRTSPWTTKADSKVFASLTTIYAQQAIDMIKII